MCIKDKLLNVPLMQMNSVPKHSRNHAVSLYVTHLGVDCQRAEFTGNKKIHSFIHSPANKHTNTQLYIVVVLTEPRNSIWQDFEKTAKPV